MTYLYLFLGTITCVAVVFIGHTLRMPIEGLVVATVYCVWCAAKAM
jgi:hypothetical protein